MGLSLIWVLGLGFRVGPDLCLSKSVFFMDVHWFCMPLQVVLCHAVCLGRAACGGAP